jgi:hypothetical protein
LRCGPSKVLLVFCAALNCAIVRADERAIAVRAELLAQMRSLAGQTKVSVEGRDDPATLVKNPVFRYDDQPRRFIDATMWLWTDGGRPIACQKIEARLHQTTGEPQWGYCFTSLAEGTLAVEWSAERKYASTQPGIEFLNVPAAPPPAARTVERRRQAREIARGFSGRILINPRTGNSAEMRLLTTPLHEFTSAGSDVLSGAVFGFETNGTNPDLLVIVEVRGEGGDHTWQFAPARMTTGGVTLNYGGKKIWEGPFVSPRQGPFSNWLFFAAPRTPVEGEATP